MMTKVRGGKGFDALFSRFFDEPGLKSAVDSLHDNFSSAEAEQHAEAPAAPTVAKRAPATAPAATKKQVVIPAAPVTRKKQVVPPVAVPVATKKQVVAPAAPAAARKPVAAPVVTAKTPVSLKSVAPKKEIMPDKTEQEQAQDLDPDQLEQLNAISSELTTGWSIELLEQLTVEMDIVPTEGHAQGEAVDQLPVIDIDEPVLENALEDVPDAVAEPEAAVSAAAPAPDVREVVVTPLVHSVTMPEAVAAPVTVAPSASGATVNSSGDDDDDDHLIEDFFSRKAKLKLPSYAPVAAHAALQAPDVAPFVHHQPALVNIAAPGVKSAPVATPAPVVTPAPVNVSTPVTAVEAPLPAKVAVPVEKSLSQILVHPQPQCEDLSSQSRRRPLSKEQGMILVYLYEVAQGCSNVETISRDLTIDSHTVRESLLVLVTEGYLYLLDKKRDSRVNPAGFSYRMNNYLCSRYAARVRGGGEPAQGHLPEVSIWRSERPASGAPIPQPIIFSSSVAKEKQNPALQKEKVTETPAAPAEPPVLSGAVAEYWQKEGLEEPLAQKWCATFGVEPEQMHQQLEWARFDLETNKRREIVKKDMISWFYDRLMITGGIYPRPANYRTAEELRAEALQHQHENDLSAQAKIVELEFENSLQAFLADPEAPLYQELLERVNSFALEQLRTGEGKAEEIGLDALFKLHWGATGNDAANPTVSFALSGLGAGQSDKPLALAAGWNLVGYDAVYSQPVHHAISSITTLIESIWGWSSGQWLSYVPNRQINSLTTLEPGMGYWIKMKQSATWTLP
ncbi:MAG TPA: hypothetical protein HPP97_02855 [Desulfuromonadales bacterium]|nr:hypothetical protein [Desulfuromonadales bacterium]